jgi:hypothetical protein
MQTYAENYDYHYHQHAARGCAAVPSAAANAERHVLAERYKTKMCRNYLQTGECPYEIRCMFAHGDHELRSCEMNIRDGLITEEAIKDFQRVLNMRNRQAGHGMAGYVPDYVGMPPADMGPRVFTHNPYGYSVVRPSTPEEYYSAVAPVGKVDPSIALEP